MKSPRVSLLAVVSAVLAVFPGLLSQAQPTIEQYATACYAAIGDPSKATDANPFATNAAGTGIDCTTVKQINTGGTLTAEGTCLSPSWAPTHCDVKGNCGAQATGVPFQCFPGSYVKKFTYTNLDTSTVTGAVLCKNETPADNMRFTGTGVFDYVSMILYNNKKGLSCWFAAPKADTGLPPDITSIRDGKNVPDPGKPGADKYWEPPLPVAATNCWRCHDNGVWMNSPWFYISNSFQLLKNRPVAAPYGFAANTGNFGFQNWPVPVFVSPASNTCLRCHAIGARQTANGAVSNNFREWLGYVTGGSTSPVPNQAPVTQDPPGQTAGVAFNQDGASWVVTHWMPEDNPPQAPAAYANQYKALLLNLQSCMQEVGQFADSARRAKRNVLDVLKLANTNQLAFSITGDCHVYKKTFAADPPPASAQPRTRTAGPQRNASGPSRPAAHPNLVLQTDSGLTLSAQLVGPDGGSLGTVTNMQPGEPPVNIPSGSSLTLSWDPGPNAGCSVFAYFPPGVIVPTLMSPDGAGSAGSGYNWLPGEGPEGIGPLMEPGLYTFNFDCGFQTDAEVTTETFITLNLVPPLNVSPNPPFLMTLATSTQSNYAEAVDYISYANPQTSYTFPAVPAGQIPQTNVPVGPSDNILLTWVAQDNVPGSCTLSEIGGISGLSPINSDAGQTNVTLGSAAFRLFQLTCMDLNGGLDELQAKISAVPSIKLNVTTTPSSGVTDTTYVNITGSGFPRGTVNPANVIVNLAASCGGSPLGTSGATSVVPIIGTSDRVQFLIPGLDPGVYYVTISDLAAGEANFSSGNCSMLTVADQ
jgi:hypothetical protein